MDKVTRLATAILDRFLLENPDYTPGRKAPATFHNPIKLMHRFDIDNPERLGSDIHYKQYLPVVQPASFVIKRHQEQMEKDLQLFLEKDKRRKVFVGSNPTGYSKKNTVLEIQ